MTPLRDDIRRRYVRNTVEAYHRGELMTGEALWCIAALGLNLDARRFLDAASSLERAEAYSDPDYHDGAYLPFYSDRQYWNRIQRENAERELAGHVAELAEVAA